MGVKTQEIEESKEIQVRNTLVLATFLIQVKG